MGDALHEALLPDGVDMTEAQAAEIGTELVRIFRGDAPGIEDAQRWLRSWSGVWNCTPIERLKRGEKGVKDVLEYLRRCPT